MMRKLTALLLSGAMLLCCIGCQNNIPEEAPPADPPVQETVPTQPPVDPEPPVAPPADEEVTPPVEEAVEEPVSEIPEEPYVRTVDPSKPMVALTFDDGPHEVYSDQILDILEEHHSVATFFEVGRYVGIWPEPVQRMVEMGCEVASHSYNHADLTLLGWDGMIQNLAKADQNFINAIGYAPILVRPPYGAINKTVQTYSGRAMMTWTVDPQDWLSQDAAAVVEYLQNYDAEHSLDGEVVLLHSIHGSTVEALVTLVPWLIEQGYQLVTVSELMAYYYGEHLQPNRFYGYSYFSSRSRTDSPIEPPTEPIAIQVPAPPAPAPSTPPAEPVPEAPPAEEPQLPEEEPQLPDQPAEGDPTPDVPADEPQLPAETPEVEEPVTPDPSLPPQPSPEGNGTTDPAAPAVP